MSLKIKFSIIFSSIVTVILLLNTTLHYFSTRELLRADQEKQMEIISKEIAIAIEHSEYGSKYVEDLIGQELRIAALAAQFALKPDANKVSNDELVALSKQLGISHITLLQEQGKDIKGVKSSDSKEMNLSTKDWGYWFVAFQQLLLNKQVTIPEGQKLPNYWSGPFDISSSDPKKVDKWGYYYDGTTNYIINPYVRDEYIKKFEELTGPKAILEKTVKNNNSLLEITGFNPKTFGKPLIVSDHNGVKIVELANRPIYFGGYTYEDTKKDVASVRKAFETGELVSYDTKVKGKDVIKTFIPISAKKPYVIGLVTDYKVIQDVLNLQLLTSLGIGLLLLFIFYICSYRLAGYIVNPIYLVLDKVKEIANGNFGAQVKIAGKDELGMLADQVNIMSENLGRYTKELHDKNDELRLYAKVFENTFEGVIITDTNGIIKLVNPAFTLITGYKAEEIIGHPSSILESKRQDCSSYETITELLYKEEHWQGEVWNRRKNGEVYPQWQTISTIKSETGEILYFATLFTDISERKRVEEQIKNLAYYDVLTHLPNRTMFNERLKQALVDAESNESKLAVMFLDLDRFKSINDTLGHAFGDLLLQGVAERLKSSLDKGAIIARLGGDEFMIILPDMIHTDEVINMATKVINTFNQPFTLEGHEIFVTTSIGISMYPSDGNNADILIKNADTAMYRVKDHGRNSYEFYDSSMNNKALGRLQLENSLRKALERGEFLVYYQPQIDTVREEIKGMEALIRWENPELGMVSPADFIPVAEETGMIVPIGEWVLRTACQQAKTWQQEGLPPIRVAVNLSVRQFQQSNLVQTVSGILKETGLDAQYLELEITESMTMHNVERAIFILHELKSLGIKISIDDFGTGYSSLGYLKRFPIDILKIDQSFIRDMTENPEDNAIVVALTTLAHNLNLKVIAEGVETEEQLRFLREKKCDQIQGYFFSPPVSAEKAGQLLLFGLHVSEKE